MWKWLDWLLYGASTQLVAVPPTQEIAVLKQAEEARGRSSLIFDSHVMSEAASGSNPQAVSLAWDEGKAYGFNVAPQSWMGMTPRERKETLLSIFLANPWASNCIDTIALYITSGGYTIEPRVENPDEKQHDEIEEFLHRVNEDWDFDQLVYDQLTDEDIFGECFTEYTMKGGKPYQLFPIDCLTMDTEHDKYGRVTRYKQQLTSTSAVNYLDPKTIIRWWNPHKRAKVDPFSPLEGIQDAILLDKKMVNWTTTFFQKGAKFPFTVEGITDQDEADRFLSWFKANYTGEKNAQNPFVAWGGAVLKPMGKGSIDIDFDKGLDRQQAIVLANFHVPPALACISETGNRLTDMSDGQRKILQYIACDPRRRRFFEKFNYRLIYPFWSDWRVGTRYADFRDDEQLAKVADTRIRNGSQTINEVRQEMGRDAYEKGGDTPLFAVSKEVTPVERLDEMADEQRQTAQVTLDTAKANADLAQTKAKQAKEPPDPTLMPALQKGQQGVAQNATTPPAQAKAKKPAKPQESLAQHVDRLVEQGNTGMMIAFKLDPEIAQQLAIPGGEEPEDMHITLAYLGDMEGPPASDSAYMPHTFPDPFEHILRVVASTTQPLSGKIGGIGRFSPAETETTPVIATVDVPGLSEFRTELVDALQQANCFVADNHGYTPHITLAYIDSNAEMPVETVPSLPLAFDTVWLVVGENWTPFRLGGIEPPPVGESEPLQRKDYLLRNAFPRKQWNGSHSYFASKTAFTDKESNENHEEQAPNPQSHATDDVREGQDQGQSDGALHQAQEAIRGDGSNDDGSSGSSTTGEAITTRIASKQEDETRGSAASSADLNGEGHETTTQTQTGTQSDVENSQVNSDIRPETDLHQSSGTAGTLHEDAATNDIGSSTEADVSVDQAPHWQDTDDDTQKALVALKAKGVAYLTWEADNSPDICDNCVANHGQRVKVGERFNSQAYYTPEHDHCGCQVREEMEDGSIVSGGEKL